jgi:hypothetical protein
VISDVPVLVYAWNPYGLYSASMDASLVFPTWAAWESSGSTR